MATRSKVRNVFGEPTKEKFLGININVKALESAGAASSLDYIAFPCDVGGGGVVGVLHWSQLGNRTPATVQFKGHKGPIQDICFSPFYDSIFATASDDQSIKIWEVPQFNKSTVRQDSITSLEGHDKRVLNCVWNPVADWILASGSQDGTVKVWNVETQSILQTFKVQDAVQHVKWNFNGSLLGSATKDKMLRIVDPRSSKIVQETNGHEGTKGTKLDWLGGSVQSAEYLFTAGFEKGPGRECALWDMRKFDKPVQKESLGRGSGGVFPFWDCDTGLVFIPGRGDGNARVIDLSDGSIIFCQEYRSQDSARGFGFAPKRSVDVLKFEVARMYKIDSATSIQPIQFIIPRKATEFAEDLFPPCFSGEPALTPDEWIGNKNAEPLRAPMNPNSSGVSPFHSRGAIGALNGIELTKQKPGSPPLTSSNTTAAYQRQLSRVGSKVSDLNSTVRLCSREIIDLKSTVDKITGDLDSSMTALKQSQDQNVKLRKQIEELEKRNQDLEDLFVSCQMAMHAAAKAEK